MFAPEWLVLGVNNICNLHCKMCDVGTQYNGSNFYQNLMGAKPLNMPRELVLKLIDQAAEHYPKAKIGYAFTEPLVYPHLVKTIAYANRKGLYTSITTNALTLRQKASQLAEAGLDEIFISLDGPPEIHNRIRGHKSSFQWAMAGIQKLLEHEVRPQISVFCCITEWNIGHLSEFADLFRDIPLKQLGFMHTNYTNQEIAEKHNLLYGTDYPATVSNLEEVNIDNMDLSLLYEEIQQIRQSTYPFQVIFSPEIHDRMGLDIFYHHPEILIGKRCNDVFRNVMIKSDGSVIPAHGRCYNLTLGNMYESTLPEIWNSAVASRFRKDLINAGGLLPACSRCCSAF